MEIQRLGGRGACPDMACLVCGGRLGQVACYDSDQLRTSAQPGSAVSSRTDIRCAAPTQVHPDYLPWFANYMVVKRAAQEANYHVLYMLLCDKVGVQEGAVGVLCALLQAAVLRSGVVTLCTRCTCFCAATC